MQEEIGCRQLTSTKHHKHPWILLSYERNPPTTTKEKTNTLTARDNGGREKSNHIYLQKETENPPSWPQVLLGEGKKQKLSVPGRWAGRHLRLPSCTKTKHRSVWVGAKKWSPTQHPPWIQSTVWLPQKRVGEEKIQISPKNQIPPNWEIKTVIQSCTGILHNIIKMNYAQQNG